MNHQLFSQSDRNSLLGLGFTNADIAHIDSYDLDKDTLANQIRAQIETYGLTPTQIRNKITRLMNERYGIYESPDEAQDEAQDDNNPVAGAKKKRKASNHNKTKRKGAKYNKTKRKAPKHNKTNKRR